MNGAITSLLPHPTIHRPSARLLLYYFRNYYNTQKIELLVRWTEVNKWENWTCKVLMKVFHPLSTFYFSFFFGNFLGFWEVLKPLAIFGSSIALFDILLSNIIYYTSSTNLILCLFNIETPLNVTWRAVWIAWDPPSSNGPISMIAPVVGGVALLTKIFDDARVLKVFWPLDSIFLANWASTCNKQQSKLWAIRIFPLLCKPAKSTV